VHDIAAALDPDLGTASARFFRVLGDPTRLAVLGLLLDRPRTVSELVDALGVRQSKVSNHLACLRWCRFVEGEREGRQVTYRVADRRLRRVLEHGRQVAEEHCEHLASCRRIGPDWV
jgi:DNA-binding transcriptional ArsR family regulator